jgi:hypothetical protein
VSYQFLPDGELDQGDIIRQITLMRKSPGLEGAASETLLSHVFVLSNGCEIDKPDKPEYRADAVLVARVIRVSSLPQTYHGGLRANKILSALYLPKIDPLPEECFIDWRTVQPVDKAALLAARSSRQYICTLDSELLQAASLRFWDFFFRPRPLESPAKEPW